MEFSKRPRRMLYLLCSALLLLAMLPTQGGASSFMPHESIILNAYEGYDATSTTLPFPSAEDASQLPLSWESDWLSAAWQPAVDGGMSILATMQPGLGVGIYTDTLRISHPDGAQTTLPVMFTVLSNRLITPPSISFGDVWGYAGEVSTAVQVGIDGSVSNLQATSSNPDFSVSITPSSLSGTAEALLSIKARNGLDAGEHIALVTLLGEGCSTVIPVSFSVTVARSLHAPQGASFAAVSGYVGEPITTLEIGVSGTAANLQAESDNRNLTVSIAPSTISAGEKAILTVQASGGLSVGKHTAYVVVTADGFLPATFPVTFNVNQSNGISAPMEVFFSTQEGYAVQPYTTAQIGVTGMASNIRVQSSNPAIEAFLQPTSLSGNETATLTVRARPGLSPNTYTSVVSLAADECNANIYVTLTVEPSAQALPLLGAPADAVPPAEVEMPIATPTAVPQAPSISVNVTDTPRMLGTPIAATAGPTPEVSENRAKIINCEEWVNVRSGPGTEHSAIGRAMKNEEVEILERNGESTWYKVRYHNGSATGWVYGRFIWTYQ